MLACTLLVSAFRGAAVGNSGIGSALAVRNKHQLQGRSYVRWAGRLRVTGGKQLPDVATDASNSRYAASEMSARDRARPHGIAAAGP